MQPDPGCRWRVSGCWQSHVGARHWAHSQALEKRCRVLSDTQGAFVSERLEIQVCSWPAGNSFQWHWVPGFAPFGWLDRSTVAGLHWQTEVGISAGLFPGSVR